MSAFPHSITESIRQILASVRDERRSGAVIALFAGATGTGKTIATEAIADELGVNLLRVDLARIVSKYIGETEKNLKRIFDEAKNGGAVLLIEEADALFGKRTEVRDAHDRYANIDAGYFVQRLEAHNGLVILTTNRKKDIDQAFLRRLRFIVEFPRGDLNAREQNIEDLKQRLLNYLIAHPSACDTQEGIKDWWLTQTAAHARALAGTLADLEAQGAISRSIRGGQEFWHAPKANPAANIHGMRDELLHELRISLPEFEAATQFQVVADHSRVVGAFIFASQLEELKAFHVVDALVEMFQRGDLPLSQGTAGTQLYKYWRAAPNRLSEAERQGFYSVVLGLPTGQPGVALNHEFQHLWLRFISSVSSLAREGRADPLLSSDSQSQVRTAARELALNMSAHADDAASHAAADLQQQIKDMIAILADREVQGAFGARDMWGMVDHIAQAELGGARNSSRRRMLATAGLTITNWLSSHSNQLVGPTGPIIDIAQVARPRRRSGETATSNPTDRDLVYACDMWLAASAPSDDI